MSTWTDGKPLSLHCHTNRLAWCWLRAVSNRDRGYRYQLFGSPVLPLKVACSAQYRGHELVRSAGPLGLTVVLGRPTIVATLAHKLIEGLHYFT